MKKSNIELIESFLRDKQAEGKSERRLQKYKYTLRPLSIKLNKKFTQATREDLKTLIIDLENSKRYKENTINSYKIILRIFYKYLKQDKKVDWIKVTEKNTKHMLPEELLIQEDIFKLIEVAEIQGKAIVALLYESGMRAGEFLSLKLKHVKFDDCGAVIIIPDGKTGARRIRVYDCAPHLKNWINTSNLKPEDHLFRTNDEKKTRLTYEILRGRLRNWAKQINLNKRINPHIFRHSRATFLANYLTEAQMKQYFGWTQNSEMAAIYVHLSGRDTDDALLSKVYKVKQVNEEAQEQILKPKKCPRCNEINSPQFKFCSKCSMVLDLKTVISLEERRSKADEIMDKLLEDSEFKEMFIKKLKGLE